MKYLKLSFICIIILLECFSISMGNVNASSEYSTSDFDNDEMTIGVVGGFIFGDLVKEKLPNANIRYFNTREAAFRALSYGDVDGVVDDDAIIRSVLRTKDDFYMADGYLEECDYAYIFTRNETGEKLSEAFSEYVRSLKSDGTLAALDDKWFGNRTDNKKSDNLPIAAEDSDKTIRLALSDDGSIPFAYMSAGKPVGYDIDIIIGFCKENGYSVSVEMMDFREMQRGVADGTYDLGCGGITVTEERKKDYNFCEPVYSGGVAICARKQGTGVKSSKNVKSAFTKDEVKRNSLKRHFKNAFIDSNRYLLFVRGICVTLIVTLFAVLIGSPMGFLLYKGSKRGNLIIKCICRVILWLVQGVPAVMIIISLYYAFYRNMFLGSVLASIMGFAFAFAEMSCRNIERNAKRIDEGKLAEDYRLEYFDDVHFIKKLFKASGEDVIEDFRDNIITIIKSSAVIGYVSAQDMVKTFDSIRMDSLETVIPLLATTVVYIIIIKIITGLFRTK